MSRIYYILITGFTLLCIVFPLIVKQNFILTKKDKSKGYNAYNQKKDSAASIMQYWRQDVNRIEAVRRIVYLDYVLMLVYGCMIAYGLYFFAQLQPRVWLKYFLRFGILLIIAGVLCDAIQDRAIFQHLTKNKFTDFRYLTSFKFICIIFSVILLITGIVYHQKGAT